MSKIELTIAYATLNKNYDLVGKMENYVRVKVSNGLGGSTEFKTKIVPGEKDTPIRWDEQFSIPLKAKSGAIFEFSVLDEDMSSDDVCGTGLFKPDPCGAFNYGAPQKYNIRLINGKSD